MTAGSPKKYFMDHEQMDFEIQILLGHCYYGSADAGEILATIDQIESGNFEQWFLAFSATAQRLENLANQSARAGHSLNARHAHLRAANYYSVASIFIDGTADPSRGIESWKQHLHCWDEFCQRLTPAAQKVEIPFENTTMPGYFFTPKHSTSSNGPHPTIIFNNGSDGPTAAMWTFGIAAALKRGYAALIFDGPGQNSMLWEKNIPFRPDWENVITPVVDFLLQRDDVDKNKIVLSGISQGGYWILRALAFEHRIAAGVADPGVLDVSASFFANLPQVMVDLLDAGLEKDFNEAMEEGLQQESAAVRQMVEWRFKPYQPSSHFDQFQKVRQYNARDVLGQIQCPMFIADPEDEQYWPGQARAVYDLLQCPKTLVPFTADEGANWHCQPKARALYDHRLHDWLAEVLDQQS